MCEVESPELFGKPMRNIGNENLAFRKGRIRHMENRVETISLSEVR